MAHRAEFPEMEIIVAVILVAYVIALEGGRCG